MSQQAQHLVMQPVEETQGQSDTIRVRHWFDLACVVQHAFVGTIFRALEPLEVNGHQHTQTGGVDLVAQGLSERLPAIAVPNCSILILNKVDVCI